MKSLSDVKSGFSAEVVVAFGTTHGVHSKKSSRSFLSLKQSCILLVPVADE